MVQNRVLMNEICVCVCVFVCVYVNLQVYLVN